MRKSEIISKIISPALKLWLKSQVEEIEELQIKINGGDRQILGGYISSVFLSATKAVYQGIHLNQVEIASENIRINLGEIIKGKPFRLLEPIIVTGKISLSESDLNKSLISPLLCSGLTDFIKLLCQEIPNFNQILATHQVNWDSVSLNSDKFILKAMLINSVGKSIPLIICSGLELSGDHILRFHPLTVSAETLLNDVSLNNFEIDLGSQVKIVDLTLTSGQLSCCGNMTVRG